MTDNEIIMMPFASIGGRMAARILKQAETS
jgi:hypothetical protein